MNTWERLKLFWTFRDSRWEDLTRENAKTVVYKDFSAGLITALTAIPMAMGFAIASGLRPEQGIIAGAMACLVGRTWGGSKYQVYGPTAAFIPIIYGIVKGYGHGMLVLASVLAGIVLCALGLAGLGRYARYVPNSIVVGFTVGIGITIAATNAYDVLGIASAADDDGDSGIFGKIAGIATHSSHINYYALGLGLMTLFLTRYLLKVSVFIPGPLIAIGISTALSATVFASQGLESVRSKFGSIPTDFFRFTPPVMPAMTGEVLGDLAYFVAAIVFVSGVESLLCSSMADKLAGNKKTPFNPDKEFWGQGMVQIITPMLNGFPCTGALARTATSIRSGATTPLAGYFKFALKLGIASFLATWLELIPMACIGGVLLWVSTNMIKVSEMKHVLATGWFHGSLMIYTAVMVPATDFLTGVLSALVIYLALKKFFDPAEVPARKEQSEKVRIGEPTAA